MSLFEYQPGRLPDFSLYDDSYSNQSLFPSLQYKTIRVFVNKIQENHFAESDFELIIKKEYELV